jgi:hypothetical protein
VSENTFVCSVWIDAAVPGIRTKEKGGDFYLFPWSFFLFLIKVIDSTATFADAVSLPTRWPRRGSALQ